MISLRSRKRAKETEGKSSLLFRSRNTRMDLTARKKLLALEIVEFAGDIIEDPEEYNDGFREWQSEYYEDILGALTAGNYSEVYSSWLETYKERLEGPVEYLDTWVKLCAELKAVERAERKGRSAAASSRKTTSEIENRKENLK